MSGSEWHNQHLSAPTLHLSRPDDRLLRIIAALHNYIGSEVFDEIEWRVLGKNHDKIHAFERCQYVRALGIASNRTCRTFDSAHRFVAVDSHDERITALAGNSENVDVTWVKQVEHTVGERNPTLSFCSPPFGLRQCRNLGGRGSRLQSLLATEGWK